MKFSIKHLLLAAFIALLVCSVFAVAQDDDEQQEATGTAGRPVQEVAEGVDAEDAAEEIDDAADEEGASSGLRATAFFLNYADLKIPAGERLEILIPVVSAPSNPSYEIALVAGHIATLDHARYLQNFSAQVYERKSAGGTTATIKYSVTPDVQLDPNEYAFVIAAYLRNEDNQTLMVTAFNGTMTVVEPLGFDFKGTFTLVAFFGGIGYAAYYFLTKKAVAGASSATPAPRSASPSSSATSKKSATSASASAEVDEDFIDKEHLAFLKSKARKRSASPQ